MESIFYSPKNFMLLLDNIKKNLSNKEINLKEETLSNIIIETMDHVWSSVDKKKISKLPNETSMYVLNKEIIGIILPIFNRDMNEDGIPDINNFENIELDIFGIKIKMGKFAVSIIRFLLILYIVFLVSVFYDYHDHIVKYDD